jgi:hypothetical protein
MTPRRFAPFVVLLAVLVLIAIVAPEIYTGTFSDLGTFARAAALVIGLALWVLAMRRFVANSTAGAIAAAVPVLVVLWFVLWPYLRPATEVDEAFPPVTITAPGSTTSTTTSPPTSTAAEPTADSPPSSTAETTTTTTTTTVPPEPVELSRSGFQGLTGHRGSGDAAVYRLADDSILLRFEEVDIGSGPDLEVYLVPGDDQRGLGGGHHVAALTAERGNQNYTVPDGVDLTTGTWTVLVWCETFDVEVANATLTA